MYVQMFASLLVVIFMASMIMKTQSEPTPCQCDACDGGQCLTACAAEEDTYKCCLTANNKCGVCAKGSSGAFVCDSNLMNCDCHDTPCNSTCVVECGSATKSQCCSVALVGTCGKCRNVFGFWGCSPV